MSREDELMLILEELTQGRISRMQLREIAKKLIRFFEKR